MEWIAWLREGHIAAVMRGGALSAEVVRLDGMEIRLEVRYMFVDRGSFERYEREFAPALRAEGSAKFPPGRGVSYERRVGEVVLRHS